MTVEKQLTSIVDACLFSINIRHACTIHSMIRIYIYIDYIVDRNFDIQ